MLPTAPGEPRQPLDTTRLSRFLQNNLSIKNLGTIRVQQFNHGKKEQQKQYSIFKKKNPNPTPHKS